MDDIDCVPAAWLEPLPPNQNAMMDALTGMIATNMSLAIG